MTAVCGGGDSEPKSGSQLVVFLGTAAIGALVSRYIGSWALQVAALISPLTFDLPSFCAVDPPADPGLDGADVLAILAPVHPDKAAAQAKFVQLIQRFAWYDLCQCDTGLTPTPPAAPSPPSDLPGNPQPPLPQTPCGVYEGAGQVFNTSCRVALIGSQFLTGSMVCPNTALTLVPVPAGALGWRLTLRKAGHAGGTSPSARLNWYKADNTAESTVFTPFDLTPEVVLTGSSVPSLATQFFIDAGSTGGVGTQLSVRMEFFCTAPGGTTVACCPPDTIATGLLNQILSAVLMVQADVGLVTERVDLLQRQVSPFAFIDGASHLGLSGEGEIDISGSIVGVRVELVDVLDGTVGQTAGHPETLFGTGWIRWGDDLGWRQRIFIDAESIVSTPYAAGAMTKIGYSLPAGTVIDLTELEREP